MFDLAFKLRFCQPPVFARKQLVPKHFSTETTAELVEKLLKERGALCGN